VDYGVEQRETQSEEYDAASSSDHLDYLLIAHSLPCFLSSHVDHDYASEKESYDETSQMTKDIDCSFLVLKILRIYDLL
jgi:hypothetical protein